MTGNDSRLPDIVIPAFRPEKERLSELLRRLYTQTRKPGRIIVVNTCSDYWDREIEKEFPELTVIQIGKDEFDHGETRNLGYRSGNGEIVVFMTQDALPVDDHLLENLCRHFDGEMTPLTGAVYARQIPDENCGWLEAETRKFNYPKKSRVSCAENIHSLGIKGYFCSNVCAAYRRAVLEEAGGFDWPCIFGEDMLAAADIINNGFRIVYEPEAVVIHYHNYSLGQQFRRNFDIGVCHRRNDWLFDGIPGTHEGIRLVTSLAGRAFQTFHFLALPELFVVSAVKYTGYQFGKHYESLPRFLSRKLSANENFWNRI